MQANYVPASYGLRWIMQGYVLLRQQFAALLLWSMATSLFINIGSMIPLLGQIVLVCLTPMITFLSLDLGRKIASGTTVLPSAWLQPLNAPGLKNKLLRLGMLYMACSFVIALFAVMPFFADLLAVVGASDEPDFNALAAAMQAPMMLFGAFYILLAALFWHTPALLGWHELNVRQAIVYSVIASWRNKFAMLVYAATWAGVFYGLHQIINLLLEIGFAENILWWFVTVFDVLITAALYSSFYPVYKAIFEKPAA